MTDALTVPVREPHWFPMEARTELVDALTVHLSRLDGFDPDRFTLTDVITELGVASARAQLDQIPVDRMRAAAGIPANSRQIRLSKTELAAILRTPNLPMKVQDAFKGCFNP